MRVRPCTRILGPWAPFFVEDNGIVSNLGSLLLPHAGMEDNGSVTYFNYILINPQHPGSHTHVGVEDNGSLTRVAAFPIGIDPDRFTEALEMPEVKANIAQLLNRWVAGGAAGVPWFVLLGSMGLCNAYRMRIECV